MLVHTSAASCTTTICQSTVSKETDLITRVMATAPSPSTLPPYSVVCLSTATYSGILWTVWKLLGCSSDQIRFQIKAISAGHSILATALTVYALRGPWQLQDSEKRSTPSPDDTLNDARNLLISGTSKIANIVTAWEAGYLIYDTVAMAIEARGQGNGANSIQVLRRTIKRSPVMVVHHGLLISALLYLETYVAANREKGQKVIMAFFLMNASNPLLHLRWYRRKATGQSDPLVDVALAIVFAATRFGSVWWVMREYGRFHNLGTWAAFRRQRVPCQAGTGLLTTMNGLWWLALLMQITKPSKKLV